MLLALRGRQALAAYLYLLPAYWLLMAVACLRAIAELVVQDAAGSNIVSKATVTSLDSIESLRRR